MKFLIHFLNLMKRKKMKREDNNRRRSNRMEINNRQRCLKITRRKILKNQMTDLNQNLMKSLRMTTMNMKFLDKEWTMLF